MIGKDQAPALLARQPLFDQRQVQSFVSAIEFVADDRMADMREVNPDLVLSPCERHYSKERERQKN